MLRTAAKYSNADRNGGSSAGLVALVLVMVKPVAQSPERPVQRDAKHR